MKRKDGRAYNELRPMKIELDVNMHAEGSAMITVGATHVLCVATVLNNVPQFLKGKGQGWVTAEYSMLPRATTDRNQRERRGAGGRTMEIQRLVGRSLRAVVSMPLLGERTVIVDCDVLQADGGTRTASITGAFVAMSQAMDKMVENEKIARTPVTDFVAATSVGIVDGELLLDLAYEEDSTADVDMNVVMTGSGALVEIQGTAEKTPFSKDKLDQMLTMAGQGAHDIFDLQRRALGV